MFLTMAVRTQHVAFLDLCLHPLDAPASLDRLRQRDLLGRAVAMVEIKAHRIVLGTPRAPYLLRRQPIAKTLPTLNDLGDGVLTVLAVPLAP